MQIDINDFGRSVKEMKKRQIVLIIGGGIAAYKCLELIRRVREKGISVRVVMTEAAQRFVTALSVGALSNDRVFLDLFDLNDEREIGHIRLSREADLIVIAPATADLLARMAGGHADDLATSVLLASNKPILAVPAMNPQMWQHSATQRNVALLKSDGLNFLGPDVGEMAEANEAGPGRMSEPVEIADTIERLLAANTQLANRSVLITAGPTYEPIDPIRYITNRSSGIQGYAIAVAARNMGADVTLISGPTSLVRPHGLRFVAVETAREMLAAVEAALPADIAIFTAAVSDWRVDNPAQQKIKKTGKSKPIISFTENPDILRTVAHHSKARPKLVIGFAAETENVIAHAQDKLAKKGCDWIIANDVSLESGIMGGTRNAIHLVSRNNVESWPEMGKQQVAEKLLEFVVEKFLAQATD